MATLQQERSMYAAMFGDDCCCASDYEPEITLEEIDIDLSEAKSLLSYALDTKEAEEIKYWRKQIQELRCKRRMLVAVS